MPHGAEDNSRTRKIHGSVLVLVKYFLAVLAFELFLFRPRVEVIAILTNAGEVLCRMRFDGDAVFYSSVLKYGDKSSRGRKTTVPL